MKKLREEFRRIGAICLTAVMLVTQTPVMAFAAEEEISVAVSEDDIVIDDTDDVITSDESLPGEEKNDAAEEQPAFEESETIDGVKITVAAEEGVFPEGAVLSVEKVTKEQEKQAEDAVEAERSEEQNVAAS